MYSFFLNLSLFSREKPLTVQSECHFDWRTTLLTQWWVNVWAKWSILGLHLKKQVVLIPFVIQLHSVEYCTYKKHPIWVQLSDSICTPKTGWTAFLQTSHMAEMHRFPMKIKNWSQIVSLNKTEFLERRRLNNNESSTFIRIFLQHANFTSSKNNREIENRPDRV